MLVKEGLGQGNMTDFLSVSFSSNDYVIHVFGPSSQGAEHNLVRLDSTLAEFFK
ncbi:alkaline phosphatase family protein [Pseudoalteromonas sp. G4]|uniref:alkaline phosphatase family protein n=1 Tax=Pseudoalteromonas sp. G4 TaxID=2992761 RepID=UPI003158B24A